MDELIRDKSQNERILKYLKTGATITPKEAIILFGCFRLAARIYDLKRMGDEVITEMQYKGRIKFARYRLIHK